MAVHLFAAIAIGSFELELGIYEISAKTGIHQVDHVKHMISLGKDTYQSGKISYRLVDEMCQVLEEFGRIMKGYQVEDYRAYATSALREAKNNQIILDQIFVRTGIRVRIISNSERRFLSYKAIATREAEFEKIIQKGTAIVDVGFGSMQLSLFDKSALISTQNMSLGTLKIRDMYSHLQIQANMRHTLIGELVDNELISFRKLYLKDRDIRHIIGVGESILYLFRPKDGSRIRERIRAEEFKAFCEYLVTLPVHQIEDEFGVNADYAALLIPSAIIFKQILEKTGAEMLWIPGIHLCDGMAAEYGEEIKQIRFTHSFENDILASARNIAKRYRCHISHVQSVEQHALRLFDGMKRYHGLGNRERLLLQIATILHDCGKFISMNHPGQSAYHIIMATEIIGLSHREREMVANVVRYNGDEFDYNQMRLEDGQSDSTSVFLAKLTAMLRLANAMDRSHAQKLEDCRIHVKDGELIIGTGYEGDLTLEAIAINHRGDFFEEIFGIRPILKQKRRV